MTDWQRLHTDRVALCPACLTPVLESRPACECADGPALQPDDTFAIVLVDIAPGGQYRLQLENVGEQAWRKPVETSPWSLTLHGRHDKRPVGPEPPGFALKVARRLARLVG